MTIAPEVEVEILNEANGVISNEQISDHSASDDEGNESEDDPLDRIKFPKSLLKRIVKEQMESSGAAGDDLSKVQVRVETTDFVQQVNSDTTRRSTTRLTALPPARYQRIAWRLLTKPQNCSSTMSRGAPAKSLGRRSGRRWAGRT